LCGREASIETAIFNGILENKGGEGFRTSVAIVLKKQEFEEALKKFRTGEL